MKTRGYEDPASFFSPLVSILVSIEGGTTRRDNKVETIHNGTRITIQTFS